MKDRLPACSMHGCQHVPSYRRQDEVGTYVDIPAKMGRALVVWLPSSLLSRHATICLMDSVLKEGPVSAHRHRTPASYLPVLLEKAFNFPMSYITMVILFCSALSF
jgi:hypothetical protein